MKAEEMFLQFCRKNGIKNESFDAWNFGDNADALADLVLQGRKTAAASAYPCYEHDKTPLPCVGQYSVVLNSRNEAVCVIRTTLVYICAFHKVPPLHAAKEGEGDRSLAYWRQVHADFFTQQLQQIGQVFDKEMPVVCEEFELVYPENKEEMI